MKTVAIITARGGSKRIPGKNIKEFCGKPIIAYSVEAALKSGVFDEVMVSTDSERIAAIAKQYGASVPFYRSEKTSDDFSTTSDVLEAVLGRYHEKGIDYQYLACIYPTAPLLTSSVLKDAFHTLISTSADTVFPVVRYSYPPQRSIVINHDGYASFAYPENAMKRSQDLPPLFHDCGQFYFIRTAAFEKNHKIIMERSVPIELSEMYVQDIDDLTDWALAEMKYQIIKKGHIYGD